MSSASVKLSSPQTRQFWEIPVLYRDEHLLALNKPPGLAVSPDPNEPDRPSLVSLLHAGIAAQKPWARDLALSFLSPALRLDTEIGGLLLFARNKPTLLKLADWFGAGKPGRSYVVLAQGEPADPQFVIEASLAPHPARHDLVVVDARRGKRARTECEVLERFDGYALLRCDALHDRKHQVRAHLKHARLPIVGDRAYGGRPLLLSRLKADYRLKRDRLEQPLVADPALYAATLALPHPVTGHALVISAPMPKTLDVAAKYLRRFAGTAAMD